MLSLPRLVTRTKNSVFQNVTRHIKTSSNSTSSTPTMDNKEWTETSKRTGLLAMKIGMLPHYDEWGKCFPVTVLQVESCQVVAMKTEAKHGYTALQVGGGLCKVKNMKKPVVGQYEAAGVIPKRSLQEFRVTPDALLLPGTPLTALHFIPGQMIDICGTSIGKGFQGVMKLHNFAGQEASHGNSKAHRLPGSTGQCQDPGRVFKGKKMAGRMGGNRVTVDNVLVCKIDPTRNLIYVKGPVPGNKGGMVRLTDARKKAFPSPPPFPTFVASSDETSSPHHAPKSVVDPFAFTN